MRLTNRQIDRQTDRQTDTDRRMDGWTDRQADRQTDIFGIGVDLELDIALVHPWSNDTEVLSATTQRAAATRRENLKIKKYDQELLPGSFRPTFVPIVFKHFGCWGEKAGDYLKKLSQLSRDEDRKPTASTFKTYWRSVFSVCLQRSNARVIDSKIKKIVSRDSNININSCR